MPPGLGRGALPRCCGPPLEADVSAAMAMATVSIPRARKIRSPAGPRAFPELTANSVKQCQKFIRIGAGVRLIGGTPKYFALSRGELVILQHLPEKFEPLGPGKTRDLVAPKRTHASAAQHHRTLPEQTTVIAVLQIPRPQPCNFSSETVCDCTPVPPAQNRKDHHERDDSCEQPPPDRRWPPADGIRNVNIAQRQFGRTHVISSSAEDRAGFASLRPR